jgi:hypothetical protein
VVLATMGNMISDNANAPAQIEKCPRTNTITKNANIPRSIEGNSINTSLKNRIDLASLLSPYSDRNTPDITPIGIPIMLDSPIIIKVPWIAGPIPPSPEPIDPGVSVKNSTLIAEMPFLNTSIRILPNGIIAIITHAKTIIRIVLSTSSLPATFCLNKERYSCLLCCTEFNYLLHLPLF